MQKILIFLRFSGRTSPKQTFKFQLQLQKYYLLVPDLKRDNTNSIFNKIWFCESYKYEHKTDGFCHLLTKHM